MFDRVFVSWGLAEKSVLRAWHSEMKQKRSENKHLKTRYIATFYPRFMSSNSRYYWQWSLAYYLCLVICPPDNPRSKLMTREPESNRIWIYIDCMQGCSRTANTPPPRICLTSCPPVNPRFQIQQSLHYTQYYCLPFILKIVFDLLNFSSFIRT